MQHHSRSFLPRCQEFSAAGSVSGAQRNRFWLVPAEQPETRPAGMQVKIESDIRTPMGRVLDVAWIGGMQVAECHCLPVWYKGAYTACA
jgi:hypothetical protein